MAKFKEDPIDAADVAQYLATQDDFALELFVYGRARELGLEALHGGTYQDPLTGKSRQFDVRASSLRGSHRLDLAIECKSLRNCYPLLISRIGRVEAESFHQIVHSFHPDPHGIGDLRYPAEVLTHSSQRSIYHSHDPVGKSTTQIGKDERDQFVTGDGQVFEKWSQALASADELISDAFHHYRTSGNHVCLTAVLPVLVVSDGTLWVADYSDDGALKVPPTQVNDAVLYVGQEYARRMNPSFTISHLHVCTKTGVQLFLEQVAHDDDFWSSLFPVNV